MIIRLRKIMSRDVFAELDDEALGAACAEPMMEAGKQTGRQGGDFRTEVMNELTPGQLALFYFHSYYRHAFKSADDFRWWTAYFLPQANLWSGIKNAFLFFGDSEMLELLEGIEKEAAKKLQRDRALPPDVTSTELYTDARLQPLFEKSYAGFQQGGPATIRKIAGYIRKNSEKFIQWA